MGEAAANSWSTEVVNGYLHIRGPIDERVILEKIGLTPGTDVALNLKGVEAINSVGTGHWIRFWTDWTGEVEIHEASVPFMTAVTMMPAMLAPHKSLSMLKSFFMYYFCSQCELEFEGLVRSDEIRIEDDEAFAPLKMCERCGGSATVDEEMISMMHIFVENKEQLATAEGDL